MARKPTIWEALAARLGREPSHAEACAEVRRILAAEYVAKIGYNPFEDDPTTSAEEVANTLREYDDEVAAAAAAPAASN
jgi:hypothetical protein